MFFNPNQLLAMLQQAQNQQRDQASDVPPSIRTALHFLHQLTHKTASIVAPNNVGSSEIVDGQKLTKTEVKAQDAACELLIAFFDRAKDMCVNHSKAPNYGMKSDHQEGIVLPCPMCMGNKSQVQSCMTCGGSGEISLVNLG